MSEELNNRNEISSSQNKDTQNQNTQSQSSGTTYSWVNPKVHQQSGSQGSANPWGSGSTWSGQGTGGQNGGRGGEKQQYYYSTGTAGTQTAAGHGKAGKVKAKKTRQPMGTGKKWAMTVAMALVFGVVARRNHVRRQRSGRISEWRNKSGGGSHNAAGGPRRIRARTAAPRRLPSGTRKR